MIITEEDYLEHYGVKGMKWGVRRQRRIDVLRRAGAKDSTISTRVRAATNLGVIDLAKGRGIRGGAARKATRLTDRRARIKAGEASVMDKLKHYGSYGSIDAIPVRAKNADKPGTASRDKKIVLAVGAAYVAQALIKQAVKNSAKA